MDELREEIVRNSLAVQEYSGYVQRRPLTDEELAVKLNVDVELVRNYRCRIEAEMLATELFEEADRAKRDKWAASGNRLSREGFEGLYGCGLVQGDFSTNAGQRDANGFETIATTSFKSNEEAKLTSFFDRGLEAEHGVENELKEFARAAGGLKVGIASVDAINEFAPKGYRPGDLLRGAQSVLVIAGNAVLGGSLALARSKGGCSGKELSPSEDGHCSKGRSTYRARIWVPRFSV